MGDLFDYIHWRGDLTLRQFGLCEVDSLILCRMSYVPFDDIVQDTGDVIPLRETFETCQQDEEDRLFLKPEDEALFAAMAGCERFGSLGLSYYRNIIDPDAQKQFSAILISLHDGTHYVAFRGTDDTLVGWKEDFNMCYLSPIPSQLEATDYLDAIAQATAGPLRVGGHSKGGNLAVYASCHCSPATRERIVDIFDFDSPGIPASERNRDAYREIQPRLHTYLPQSSIVSMLLEEKTDYQVVKSTQNVLFQHDLFSWEIDGPHLVYEEEISPGSQFIDRTVQEWLSGMDTKQREILVDTFYNVMSATKAKTFTEMNDNWFKNVKIMLQTLKNIDEPTKHFLGEIISSLFTIARKNRPQPQK